MEVKINLYHFRYCVAVVRRRAVRTKCLLGAAAMA